VHGDKKKADLEFTTLIELLQPPSISKVPRETEGEGNSTCKEGAGKEK